MSCRVGGRHGSDPALLWLWRRPVATAPIRPLAWEPPYAEGAAQEMAKRQQQQQKETEITNQDVLYSTGNYTQNLVIIYKGKESEKEYTHTQTRTCVCA